MKALRNRIRRILPVVSGHRQLTMPVLETKRLVLRKFEQNDLGDIIRWEEISNARIKNGSAEISRLFLWGIPWGGAGPWGMQLKESGEMVGNCGFPHIIFEELCGEVNY